MMIRDSGLLFWTTV